MPILITPEKGRQKMRKGNSPKLDETLGFQCLGHLQPDKLILSQKKSPFYQTPIKSNFFIHCRDREGGSRGVQKMGKWVENRIKRL